MPVKSKRGILKDKLFFFDLPTNYLHQNIDQGFLPAETNLPAKIKRRAETARRLLRILSFQAHLCTIHSSD